MSTLAWSPPPRRGEVGARGRGGTVPNVQHERVAYRVVIRTLGSGGTLGGGEPEGESLTSPEDAIERADELAEKTGTTVEVQEVIVHADGTTAAPRIVYVTG